MPFESPQDLAADPLVSRPHRIPTPLMLAGVAGACVLGAGLGLWARPSGLERALAHHPHAALPQPHLALQPRQIEIRVDGAQRTPALAAHPVAVTPPTAVARPAPAPATPPAELLAPKPAPEGLMRVHAVEPQRLAEAPRALPRLPSTSDLAAQAAAERRAQAAAQRRATAARKAEAAARAEREEARAEARAEAARKARLEAARLEKAKVAAAAEARARRQAELRIAAKKAAAEKYAAAQAEKTRLAEAKADRAAAARAAAIRLADSQRKTEAKAALLRASAPVRTASARPRCASADPGAALACADPALGAADRQLSRAYRQAQAAGVPSERLERQQQRWLAARANAARQAPWAVHDIYLARIAELQDQTRAASQGD